MWDHTSHGGRAEVQIFGDLPDNATLTPRLGRGRHTGLGAGSPVLMVSHDAAGSEARFTERLCLTY